MVDHLPAGHQEASPMVSKAASPRSSSGSCSRERGRSGSTKSSSSSAGAPSTVEAGISGGTCTGITSGVGAVSTKGVSDGDSGEEYEGVMFSWTEGVQKKILEVLSRRSEGIWTEWNWGFGWESLSAILFAATRQEEEEGAGCDLKRPMLADDLASLCIFLKFCNWQAKLNCSISSSLIIHTILDAWRRKSCGQYKVNYLQSLVEG